MINPKPLSPAAQAVMAAFDAAAIGYPGFNVEPMVAAALRAAAEQVVLPKYQYADWQMAHLIMEEFQNIAAELEKAQP